ncbi:hypothetical protein DNU06_09665 [Putridiphycobacter roseus]|uniref:Heme-copper oxidase subunit III family profile domain-containing protein n=1 Tax=Putridiphycobacter roseus TaxID=2219161 RepID=A0A2W1NG48_9FLAO|nr:cytochrome c oxidase subunit 3 [Putridiphycobacter roseus]PZE17006.1 hypothetical protein DNU06_09665 [Putridiphycobacter roseus]
MEQNNQFPEGENLQAEEKIKKNLLWFGIFSIIMLFAGITSGYIVARDSSFWVNLKLPNYFMWSTILVLTSSVFLILAGRNVKAKKNKLAGVFISISLLLGLLFGYTQTKGFYQLSNQGNALTAKIINLEGRYGEYFTLYKNDKEISFDGTYFYYEGEKVSEAFKQDMQAFLTPILSIREVKMQPLKKYGVYTIKYKGEQIVYQNGRFEIDQLSLSPIQKSRIWHFAEAIIKNRGDFYMIGEYGKDFSLNYKGQPIQYENRKFYRDGQEISAYAFSELSNSNNRASSFILAFIVIHGLHWLAGIIVLMVLLIKTFKLKYTSSNYIGLKIGTIYWHFLGILWLYLYLFLNFIH